MTTTDLTPAEQLVQHHAGHREPVADCQWCPPPAQPRTPAEALRGPWHAVLSDGPGDLRESLADFDEGEEIEIAVVRGTAAPTGDRRPGTYRSADVLYELDGWELCDEDADEIADRWEQAKAVAAALNALAAPAATAADESRTPADPTTPPPRAPAEAEPSATWDRNGEEWYRDGSRWFAVDQMRGPDDLGLTYAELDEECGPLSSRPPAQETTPEVDHA